MKDRSYRICVNCIMDTSDPGIEFNNDGVCEYCQNFNDIILPDWNYGSNKLDELQRSADRIIKAGKGKDFDCIIGLSGGLDSSYTTYVAKEMMGLRPLLFHVDAGWNTDQAVGNIEKLVDGLSLDLYTEVVNWEEMKDLQLAYLKSQVPDQDKPQDTAFFSALYKFARKYKIKYILTGGNYSTECCREPEEWGAYPGIDKMLTMDIHRKFGSHPLKSYPIVDLLIYKAYYQYILGMKVFKPLNFVPFFKSEAERLLNERFGWEPFQHKHHESRFTRFFEDYWLPIKFGFEKRRAHFSSLVMTGQMTRDEALDRISRPEMDDKFMKNEFEFIANKLGITVDQLQQILDGENKTFSDYRNKYSLIRVGFNVLKALGIEKRHF